MNTPQPTSILLGIPVIGLSLLYLFIFVDNPVNNFAHQRSNSFLPAPDNISRFPSDMKHRGIHYFGRRELAQDQLDELKNNHIEWLTFVPYGWQADYDSDEVSRRGAGFYSWTNRDSAFARQITLAKDHGFRIMIKPHIWMGDNASGKWRSEIKPKGGNAGWEKWSDSYRAFILHYAEMSEQLGVELLCIGTELHRPAKEHPEFWKQLIREVRKVFSGQLTYGANWYKEADNVSFWQDLDFIGIQAYYPLCKQTNPTVENLLKGWKPHLGQLEKLHKRYNKPILFTEIGYKSTPDAAIEPWEWVDKIQPKHQVVSLETQANCYEAFFRTFWHLDWFAGAHFWQWRARGGRHHDHWQDFDFTPQNKPAEQTLSQWFSK